MSDDEDFSSQGRRRSVRLTGRVQKKFIDSDSEFSEEDFAPSPKKVKTQSKERKSAGKQEKQVIQKKAADIRSALFPLDAYLPREDEIKVLFSKIFGILIIFGRTGPWTHSARNCGRQKTIFLSGKQIFVR